MTGESDEKMKGRTTFVRSVIGALAALLLMPTAFARQGQPQRPELQVQVGHFNTLFSVAFSPDGRVLASTGHDGTVKLWDVATGTELRSLMSDSEGALAVAFSCDGRTLASGGIDKTVKLWNVTTGALLRVLVGHAQSVHSVAFSPDGGTLVSGGSDNAVKVWDVNAGKELRTLAGHRTRVGAVAFSPDGKIIASASGYVTNYRTREVKPDDPPVGSDNLIKLWDAATGAELRTLAGHTAPIGSLAFSRDGRTLVSGGDKTIRLWDVASGNQSGIVEGYTDVFDVALSPDGRTLAASINDQTIRLWDLTTGAQSKTLTANPSSGNSSSLAIAFSPDSKLLASAYAGITLFDLDAGEELRTFARRTESIYRIFSPDGSTLASLGSDKTIRLWNLASGTEVRILKSHSVDGAAFIVFSPDGKTLASSGASDRTIKLWDVATGRELRTLAGSQDGTSRLFFSPDGHYLAATISYPLMQKRDGEVKLWDVATGAELRTFTGGPWGVSAVVFSPDNRMLATSSDKTLRLWDFRTGVLLRTLTGDAASMSVVAFSPDGRKLASGGMIYAPVKVWDTASGAELCKLAGHVDFIHSLAFGTDGRTLASAAGSDDRTIKLWDVASCRLSRSMPSRDPETRREVFKSFPKLFESYYSADISGKLIAEWSGEGKIKFSDSATWKELATLITFKNDQWLVTTPEGFFDGTPAAWRQAIWRLDNNSFRYVAVEAFFSDFFRPGLLQDVYQGKVPAATSDISRKDIRQPAVTVTLTDDKLRAGNITAREVRISVEVADAPPDERRPDTTSGARDVRLFRNGYLVKLWSGDAFALGPQDGCQQLKPNAVNKTRRVLCTARVSVTAGVNQFTAYAFNDENVKSNDAALNVSGAESLKRDGTLYVLAIGVGKYSNPQFDLNYTPSDAQKFGAEIRRQQELLDQQKLGRYAHIKVIQLLNEEATKANILLALGRLSGVEHLPRGVPAALRGLQASQPEDGVIVYFSGHGTTQGDRFYLIPHNIGYMGPRKNVSFAGKRTILAHSISDVELEEGFRELDAGHLLLVIDSCNSGQALQADDWRRGPMNARGLGQLAYEKGMYVLTASQSIELAYESEALKRSYMTYALIEEALKSRVKETDTNGDGQVWLREWFDYTVQRVPRMRESKVEDAAKQRNKSPDMVEVIEQGKVQTPRVFYRREPDAQPWIVALTR